MKIEKFTKLKDNKYQVDFNNGSKITLYDDVIVKYNLLTNKEMDNKKFDEITSYNDELESYYKSIKYINKKLRSKKEIYKYLEKDYDIDIINKTIDKLCKDGYLNEELYVKAYINDQITLTLNGPYKILNDLTNLGLDEEYIKLKLEEIDDEIWNARIEKYINKKIKSNHNYSNKRIKEKISYDLSNKGYPKDYINNILNTINIPLDYNLITKEGDKIYNKLLKKYSDKELLFQLKNKLYQKGFTEKEIDYYLQKKD